MPRVGALTCFSLSTLPAAPPRTEELSVFEGNEYDSEAAGWDP